MNLYEKNLSLLRKVDNDLYSDIINNKIINKINLEKVEDQINYIAENENSRCFLHSLYDVSDEMEMTFKYANKDAETVVIFGGGCGYAIDYIEKYFNNLDKLILVEPSLDIFKEFLKYIDISKILKKVNTITLIINKQPEVAAGAISNHIINYNIVEFVSNVSYRTLFFDYYEVLFNDIIKNVQIKKSNMSVTYYSWTYWLINSIKNLKENNLRIDYIKEIFQNKPVIIVSAGPSLNKNMHLLNEVYDKAIIIAGGTAIKILENNGIKPHFRAAYDGTPAQKKVFENLEDSSIPLIYGSKIFHEIVPEYQGPKFLLTVNGEFFRKYINKKIEFEGLNITSGASISNVLVNLACEAGCSKVILLGQDLCYYDGEIYAKGSEKNNDVNKFKDKKFISEKDIYDNEVYTDFVLLNMKYYLSYSAEAYKNIKFFNCTEGGLNIDGIENKKFESIINEELIDNIRFNITDILKNINEDKILHDERQKINDVINDLKNEILDMKKINKERLDLLKKLEGKINKKVHINKLISTVRNIEKIEEKLQKFTFYGEVLANELQEKLNALSIAFKSKDNDVLNQIISFEKILTPICGEVQIYLMITEELIEEYVKQMEDKDER